MHRVDHAKLIGMLGGVSKRSLIINPLCPRGLNGKGDGKAPPVLRSVRSDGPGNGWPAYFFRIGL